MYTVPMHRLVDPSLRSCRAYSDSVAGLMHALDVDLFWSRLQDDLGWGNVGWHHSEPFAAAETPVMDRLVREGVELDRHYAYFLCSPSRASIHSGRLPVSISPRLFCGEKLSGNLYPVRV